MPPDADLIPAIGYVRVSMLREEQISPEVQRATITDWARRRGRRVVDWAEDLDMTGRDFARRKIAGTIGRIRAGEAREIAVWKYSRFGRNRLGIAVNLDALEKAGGQLQSATEEVDPRTATGRFTRGMLFEVAAFQSDLIAETWRDAYNHRVREGLPPLGRPRFGYNRLGRVRDEDDRLRTRRDRSDEGGERYVPDAALGLVLADMFYAYTDGDGGPVIAGRLNDAGVPNTYGRRWSPRTALDVMDSGFGAGYLRLHDPSCECQQPEKCRNRVYLKGAHEAVILEEEWQAYLQRREDASTTPPRRLNPVYEVSGLVRCGHCGSAMVVSGAARQPGVRFGCWRQRNYRDCPGAPSVPLTVLLAAVREKLGELAADNDARQATVKARAEAATGAAADVERLGRDVAAADRAMARLAVQRAQDEGSLSPQAWETAARELREKRGLLEKQLKAAGRERAAASAPDPLPELPGLLDLWEILPAPDVNRMLRGLIRHVEVRKTAPASRDGAGHFVPQECEITVVPRWGPGAG